MPNSDILSIIVDKIFKNDLIFDYICCIIVSKRSVII